MAVDKTKQPGWLATKSALLKLERADLVRLIAELYRREKSNRNYLHTRFALGDDALKPYRKIIDASVYPDAGRKWSLQIAKAKRAIDDYSKAARNDKKGTVELMVHFVEQGTQFALDYQFMDERFARALLGMYRRAVWEVLELPNPEQHPYWDRLYDILSSAEPIGWGYYDALLDEFFDACPEDYSQ